MHRTHNPRQLPRLLDPRLPIGPRWARFCRSSFAGDLRAAGRSLRTTATVASGVVGFYVFVNAGAALQSLTGVVA